MIFLFGVLLFLRLIIPPAAAGGVNKDRLPMGPFFFTLNQPAADGADEINIPRCRGRDSKYGFPTGASFFALNYLWPNGQR